MKFIRILLLMPFFLAFATGVNAQNTWEQCSGGEEVVRCRTYDCPNGDTNSDGACSLADNGGKLVDARNDSFCANPVSGCGQVHYYSSNQSDACSVRYEENNFNCNLYDVPEPTRTTNTTRTPAPVGNSVTNLSCSSLIVSPTSGDSPLEVKLETKSSGDLSQVSGYEFVISKSSGEIVELLEQTAGKLTRTLVDEGKYTVRTSLVKKNGEKVTSPSCSRVVEVKKPKGTLLATAASDERLPETGSETWFGLVIFITGMGGIYLFEKYRVIV